MRVELLCADSEASTQRQMCVFDLVHLSALIYLWTDQRLFLHLRGLLVPQPRYVTPFFLRARSVFCSDNVVSAATQNCHLYGDESSALTIHLHCGCSCQLVFQRETLVVLIGARQLCTAGWC